MSSLRYSVITNDSPAFSQKMKSIYLKHSFRYIWLNKKCFDLNDNKIYLLLAKNKKDTIGYAIVEYDPKGSSLYCNVYDPHIKHQLLYFEIYSPHRR